MPIARDVCAGSCERGASEEHGADGQSALLPRLADHTGLGWRTLFSPEGG